MNKSTSSLYLIILLIAFCLTSCALKEKNTYGYLREEKVSGNKFNFKTKTSRFDVSFPNYKLDYVPSYPGWNEVFGKDAGERAIRHSTCSVDSGFGYEGKCLNQVYSGSTDERGVPKDTKEGLSFILDTIYKISSPINICAGDFPGESFYKNLNLKELKCDAMSLMGNFKYGTIGGIIKNIPCPDPTTISFCAAFDRCGTVAVSINAGLLQCAATYSTGIAAILSPVAKTLDYVSFGFSPKRRFTSTFTIAYRNGKDVTSGQVTTFGHFMIGMGLSFPIEFSIGGKKLEDIISVDAGATFLVDFGNSVDIVKNLINKVKSADRNIGKQVLQEIMKTNAEMSLSIKAAFTIKLGDMTNGFLPDLSFNVGEANILISGGGPLSGSGMNRGIYLFLRKENLLGSIFNTIMEHFGPLLKIFGIDKIPFPKVSITIGLFIDTDAVGFEFTGLGAELRCMFMFKGGKGYCDFSHKFFAAIMEGAKWVIKEAKEFFDDAGREVVEFAKDVKHFTQNAAKKTEEFFKNDVRNFFERDVGGFAKDSANHVVDFVKNDVGNFVKNDVGNFVKHDVGNFVKNDVGNFFKNDVKNFFKKW